MIVRILKWGTVVILVALVANWIATWWLARANQVRIEAFFESSGSVRTYADFARPSAGSAPVAGNGWYHLLAATASVSSETADVFARGSDASEASADAIAVRERELDAAHESVVRAASSGSIVPAIDWGNPFAERPHLFAAMQFVQVACASARDASEASVAVGRLADARRVADELIVEPTLIGLMVRAAVHRDVCAAVAAGIDRIPDEALAELESWFAAFEPEAELARALRGEVFFGLWCWDAVTGRSVQGLTNGQVATPGVRPGVQESVHAASFLVELDKSFYLDAMLPLVDDPMGAPTPGAAPWYALLSGTVVVGVDGIRKGIRKAIAHRAMIREAIRLERARRADGVVPPARAEVDGVTLVVERADGAVVIRLPSELVGNDDDAVSVTVGASNR